MSNYKAITGSSKIVHRNQGGGSKKQGIPSSTNLSMWSHVAFRNRNVVCPCHRHHVFCMNQLGGIGAGGVPGNSYMFAPRADGINKNKILCNIDHKNIKHPSQFELIYKTPINLTSLTSTQIQTLFKNDNNTTFGIFNCYKNQIFEITTLYQSNISNPDFKSIFYLINNKGNKTPENLIGSEYIIIYYQLTTDGNNINIDSKELQIHFKLITYNDTDKVNPYYIVDFLGNKSPFLQYTDVPYIIKEIYKKN